jgi:cytoskeleton protein RodZ
VWERVRDSLATRVSRPRLLEAQEEAQDDSQSQGDKSVSPQRSEVAFAVSLPATPVRIKSSDEMFAGIGAQMQARRDALNLTREEIERHIRVRAHYLKALEEGDFSGLPSAVQTRGMFSNYATFLDLDVDALLLQFADVLQVRHRERHPLPPGARGRPQPSAPTNRPVLRGFIAADLLGIALIALLVGFSVWGVRRVMQVSAETRQQATAPSISDVLLEPSLEAVGTPTATSALLDLGNVTATVSIFEAPPGPPTFPEGVNVQINIVALERTFLRVTVDGKVAFDGRVTPGTAYPFDARERIEILAGNGAALRVTYNQRDLGLLGVYGQVVNLVYLAEGIITPTATLAPTATITRTPTITPSITATMVPSYTPTPR